MIKAMLFIDGSWLYHVRSYLINVDGRHDFELDYKALPELVKHHAEEMLHVPVDMVRTYYFGTLAVNKPGHDNLREKQFYDMLHRRCNYHTEIFEFDFKNRELGRKENCLEVGLSVSALSMAYQPGSFDLACLLAGDIDYQPMIRQLRSLGKRTMMVGVKGSNGFYPMHPRMLEDQNMFDMPMLAMDEHLDKLQLQRTEQLRTCDSCGKEEVSTFTSDWFYCKTCREEYRTLKGKQVIEV